MKSGTAKSGNAFPPLPVQEPPYRRGVRDHRPLHPNRSSSACSGPVSGSGKGLSDLTQRLLPPGPGHLMGTDDLGRDILSRIIYGRGYPSGRRSW
jgi:ABC-type dipeptide/oligopeptide/nickel transport system permease subunit